MHEDAWCHMWCICIYCKGSWLLWPRNNYMFFLLPHFKHQDHTLTSPLQGWGLQSCKCGHQCSNPSSKYPFCFKHFFAHGFASSKPTQVKKQKLSRLSSRKWVPPSNNKSFSCLHKQINDVLHPCANSGAWDMKSLIGISLDPNPFP